MRKVLWALLFIGIFAVVCPGEESCSKKCTVPGQICVNKNNRAECRCRDSCKGQHGGQVCGSDGITYRSRCHLDMTSCKLGNTIRMASQGKCEGISLKISPTHQSSQTLISGKPGEIRCGIEGKAAQVLWNKVGAKSLPFPRVIALNSKTLRFRRVQEQDAGQYICRGYSMSSHVRVTVTVVVKDPKTMDTTVVSNRVCNLEKLVGTGADPTNFSPRWYFDSESQMCESFLYKGSGGNENNFKTKAACMQKCSHAAGDVCSLPLHPGPCMGYMPRWFYNSKTEECESFIYGGCQANANNFKSEEKCKNTCSAEVVCKLQPEVGRCKGYFPRYFFNHTSGQCNKFIYGGCEGNGNRFPTLDLCQKKCFTASDAAVKEKPGRCPWRRSILRLCILRADTCRSDHQCPGSSKCCYDGCSRSCARPVSEDKPGKCPKVTQNQAFCDKKGDMCDKDTDCPGSRKCCHNGCQRDCTVPDTVRKLKPGVCPQQDAIDPKLCKNTKNECELDGDCFGHLKCCFNGCYNECSRTPRPIPKRGECPLADYIPPENCSDTSDKCDYDSQCPGKDKCCATGCLKECITPPVKTKPGECPLNDYIPPELCEVTEDYCEEDEDCKGIDKCCSSGCNLECITPPIIVIEKPGKCPTVDFIDRESCEVTTDECNNDYDCKGRDKCCATGCIQECVTPPHRLVTPTPLKQGECPPSANIPPENCSDTSNKCDNDSQCPGKDKCCATGCFNECITPPVKTKPGECPVNDYIPPELCEVTEDKCKEDSDCKRRDKCCFTGCILECMTPSIIVIEKPGKCPTVDFIDHESCEATTDECNNDYDCKGRDKCCATGCIQECVTPPRRPEPRKEGQCPKPWKGLNGICDRRGDMCSDDKDCSGLALCCFNGCQKDCIDPIPKDKPGVCPNPWKGQDSVCDRRGDMCTVDVDCDESEKCCFNGCQRDCVAPGKRSAEKPGQCPNPWKEQPCDRRGDMCEEDSDCDSGSKCCHNGCQKDCVKPANLTKCQEETQSALDKLAQDPPLLGVFVPKCKPDGHYEIQQCHELYCWCVDKNGKKIPDTTVRGPAVCLPRAKPGRCPKPWKGQEGFCDYRGDMCLHDSDCAGEDDRCCFNGCQNDCVPAVGIKLCTKQRRTQGGPPIVGAFVPSCKLNGGYEEVQCHGSTGFCWCVDKLGNEIQGTRTRGEPNCTLSVVIKPCTKHRDRELARSQGGPPLLGAFIPSCKLNGDYEEVQCHGSTGYCWCVDKLGIEIQGTHTRGEPNCTLSAGSRVDAGKAGTCPKPWKGLTGFCDKMGDECGMDFHCSNENEKCCYSGCQRLCVNTTEAHQKAETKPGQCPEPWLGKEGLCDRRGDMCEKDVDCRENQICCFNGCQKDCVNPGLSTCQKRYEESFLFPPLGRFVPSCKKDGQFKDTQCHPSTGHCWCVNSYGTELLGTRTRGRPNCTVPDPCVSTECPYYGQCVPSKDRKSVECKCNIACFKIYDPVCGTDGKTYGNECSMRSEACQQKKNVTVDYKGECEVVDPCSTVRCGFYGECDVVNGSITCVCPGSGSRPSCGDEKEPVCGSDGDIYDNMCHLMNASCQQEVTIRPALPEICVTEENIDPCTNITCDHPSKKCITTDGKPMCNCRLAKCTTNLQPVCGTDGQTYDNECMMDVFTCQANKIVSVDYDGKCEKDIASQEPCEKVNCSHPLATCQVINETATCVCPEIVTLEYFPVCGSDGVTYVNPGSLDIASCNSGGVVEKVKDGKCKEKIDPCTNITCSHPLQKCIATADGKPMCNCKLEKCSTNVQPVCGTDGQTYDNECMMDVFTCQANKIVSVDYDGKCEKDIVSLLTKTPEEPCEKVNCSHPLATCQVINKTAMCVCPEIITLENFPVCGSDGVTYPNPGSLGIASCNSGGAVEKVEDGKCKEKIDPCTNITCSHPLQKCIATADGKPMCNCRLEKCSTNLQPVCGTDGQTYDNECMMDVFTCQANKIVSVDYDGKCEKDIASQEPCDKVNCSHPLATCQVINETATCVCPEIVTLEYFPVCGSDRVTYPNPGSLGVASCNSGGAVEKVEDGKCKEKIDPCTNITCDHPSKKCITTDGKPMCNCRLVKCSTNLQPVCGTDGQTYDNECMMDVFTCQANKIVSVDYDGKCEKDIASQEPCAKVNCSHPLATCQVINKTAMCVCPEIVTLEYFPVCGSDGVTYANPGLLGIASCNSGGAVEKVEDGKCKEKIDPCTNITCSHPLQKCIATADGKPMCNCRLAKCSTNLQPVCGTDGQTYDNECMMDVFTCQANKIVSVDYDGKCEKDIVSQEPCAKVNCSHPLARCIVINETATCVCPEIVTLEYFPVCGSDGVTYPNPGSLGIASCNSGGAVVKVKDGKCSELKDPCEISLCSHKLHRCEIQNSTAECVCKTACTLEYDPVCASDNKTYPNKCAMDVAACETDQYLRVVRPGKCDGVIADKPNICPRPWKGLNGICDRRGDMCQNNADCGEDGEKCCFNGCQKDCVKFGDLECPEKCHHNAQCIELVFGGRKCVCNPGFEGDGIECAADPCSVKKCEHYATCQEENGMGKCVCPQVCPLIYAPVCGSDGNIYDNMCQMRVASCTQQKKITVASKDTCKPDPCAKSQCSNPLHRCVKTYRGATCICLPSACTLEYVPVCGSDGNTYPNKCALKAAACERSQNITVASQGKCKTKNTNPCEDPSLCTHPYHQCQVLDGKAVCVCPMVITANLDPVCGSDGQTYPNPGALESMSCLANRIVEEEYRGQCKAPTDPCDISLCSHHLHFCKVVEGMAKCVCRQVCPLILLPVCGSDGQTYPNNCTLEVEACVTGKDLTVASMGECDQCARTVCPDPRKHCRVVEGAPTCQCDGVCTADYTPVCGSDGKTYPNECGLEVEACKTGKNLTVVKQGECVKRKECPILNPTPSCALKNGTCFTGDVTCEPGLMCCLDNTCEHKCTHPALDDGTRPGTCPALNPIPGCASISGCESDDVCPLGERCCLQSNCTKKCVKTDKPSPPRRGRPRPDVRRLSVSSRVDLICQPPCHRFGKCVRNPDTGENECTCNRICTREYDPVCGTDGETYSTACMFMMLVCEQGRDDITIKHRGECTSEGKDDLTCDPPCHRYGKCVRNPETGENECTCSRKCTREYAPVCGTDGKTYGTECMMKLLVCNEDSDVTLKSRGECPSKDDLACDPPCHRYGKCVKNPETGVNECSCNRPCTREYAPVCGTDGKTYSTECIRMFEVCKKGTDVGLKHPGKCREATREDSCPVLNPTPTCQTVTGCSDDSECADGEKCCLREGCTNKCISPAKLGQCPSADPKPCPAIRRPAECSSDWDCLGKLKCCFDGCIRKCTSSFVRSQEENPCENTLCSYPHPVCKVIKGKATCQCRLNCPAHIDPVCASDGRTYDNMCMLETTACILAAGGMPAGQLTYLGNGECTVAQICSLPVEKGRCRASMRRFFFNSTSRQCEEFRFGGCEGNANRFDSEKACNDFCGSLDICQLQPCPDPYAICSISDSGDSRECSCPEICTADYSPVCGTDGQTYSNECQMKASACKQGMMIKVKSPGKCKNNAGFCPIVDPMICSGDQEDSCFDDASCAGNEKCCHDGCRKLCVKPLPKPNADPPLKTITRVTPLIFDKEPPHGNPCEKCKFPKSACTVTENGQAECQCPEVCTADVAPVCGSDGRNYTNKCELEVEACKAENLHTLRVQHIGPCVCNLAPEGGPCFGYIPRYFFNATSKKCEEFVYGGCQGNGNNFETIESCENQCISPCKHHECPFPHTRCEVEEGRPVCKCPIICTADYRPVCGTDGKTYGNMCGLEAAACLTKHFKLGLNHLGECLSPNPCNGVTCSHKRQKCVLKNNKAVCECNKICTREYDPYCASDGVTYANKCELEVAECESGKSLEVLHSGECTACELRPAAGPCEAYFPSYFYNASSKSCEEFVYGGCRGNDNRFQTIDDCEKKCKAETPSSDDPCLLVNCEFHGVCRVADNGEAVCECNTVCPFIYDPVCGSDGKNYSNECVLKSHACLTKTDIHVVGGPAKCASKRLKCVSCPARSNLFTHFCESDFVIEGTSEKIVSNEDTDSSGLMVQVLGVFKGSDSLQNKLIKINFAENLNSCFCKELDLRKVVVIAGSVTDEGEYLLDESSYVRHASEHLLKKVQERTKHDKCKKIKKQR